MTVVFLKVSDAGHVSYSPQRTSNDKHRCFTSIINVRDSRGRVARHNRSSRRTLMGAKCFAVYTPINIYVKVEFVAARLYELKHRGDYAFDMTDVL